MSLGLKGILLLSFMYFSCMVVACTKDSTKSGDTVLLPQSKIQVEEMRCTERLDLNELKATWKEPKVINSEAEFDSIFYNKCSLDPKVDFSASTLLYCPTGVGGCRQPTYERIVKMIGNNVIYQINITEHGWCKPLRLSDNFVVIPKLSQDTKVTFKVNVFNERE